MLSFDIDIIPFIDLPVTVCLSDALEDLERNVSDRSTLYVIGEELPDAMREALMARGGYHGTVDGITVYAPDWDAR